MWVGYILIPIVVTIIVSHANRIRKIEDDAVRVEISLSKIQSEIELEIQELKINRDHDSKGIEEIKSKVNGMLEKLDKIFDELRKKVDRPL